MRTVKAAWALRCLTWAFGVGVFMLSSLVWACSCLPPEPPQDALEKADAVFLGVVERNEVKGTPNKVDMEGVTGYGKWRLDYQYKEATFRVITVWKGVPQEVIPVHTSFHGTMCGYNFEVGFEYLVYARESDGALHTSICSRTRPRHDAGEDLQALGPGTAVLNWEQVPDFP